MKNPKKKAFYETLTTGETKEFKLKLNTPDLEYHRVDITPDEARFILQNFNNFNRKASSVLVHKYSQDMSEGQWLENGETVKFAGTGEMLDGQHRLLGIIKANVTQRVTFCYGINKDAFFTIDSGKPKTNKDILELLGYNDGALLSSLSRMILAYKRSGKFEADNFSGVNQITKREIIEFLDGWRRFMDYSKRKSIQISWDSRSGIPSITK